LPQPQNEPARPPVRALALRQIAAAIIVAPESLLPLEALDSRRFAASWQIFRADQHQPRSAGLPPRQIFDFGDGAPMTIG